MSVLELWEGNKEAAQFSQGSSTKIWKDLLKMTDFAANINSSVYRLVQNCGRSMRLSLYE